MRWCWARSAGRCSGGPRWGLPRCCPRPLVPARSSSSARRPRRRVPPRQSGTSSTKPSRRPMSSGTRWLQRSSVNRLTTGSPTRGSNRRCGP
ncbi:hypothetical protein ACFFX0_25895 [Citricoccus parietis]|uniref:Secreted protein n=1 Tax=Citricoccus parietis TaxID=592307 RepID=A0ABV5G6B4_9MICC